MFIWTISDVFGVIAFVLLVLICVCSWISDKLEDRKRKARGGV